MTATQGVTLPILGWQVAIRRPSGRLANDQFCHEGRESAARRATYLAVSQTEIRAAIVAPLYDWSALPDCRDLLRSPRASA